MKEVIIMTTHYTNTRDEFLQVINKVSDGDIVVVPTVRIMGNDADEAFNNYVSIFNKGGSLYPVKEHDRFLKVFQSLNQ